MAIAISISPETPADAAKQEDGHDNDKNEPKRHNATLTSQKRPHADSLQRGDMDLYRQYEALDARIGNYLI